MAERKFNFSLGNKNGNIGSAADEIRKLESKKDFDFRVIPKEKIKPNPLNDYPMEDIDKLMESIGEYGLIHNLRVKPTEEGLFEIISGERRYRAISLGLEKGDTRFDAFKVGIPCMVEDKNIDEVTEEIQLILANEEIRSNDEARKRVKLARLAELYKMKNQQTGSNESITKQIARDVGISERQVQRYNAINNKLIKRLQDAFDNSKINLTKASQFAAFDEETQEMIADLLETSNKITNEQLEIIRQQAREKEENLKRELDQQIEKLERIKKSNDELQKKIQETENELEAQKELESSIREEIKNELLRNNPDKEKIEELNKKIEVLNIETRVKERERKEILELYQKKENEINDLKEKLSKATSEDKEMLAKEEKEKIKKDFKINTLMNEITKNFEELSKLSEDYILSYGEAISKWDTFCIEISKALTDLQSLNR